MHPSHNKYSPEPGITQERELHRHNQSVHFSGPRMQSDYATPINIRVLFIGESDTDSWPPRRCRCAARRRRAPRPGGTDSRSASAPSGATSGGRRGRPATAPRTHSPEKLPLLVDYAVLKPAPGIEYRWRGRTGRTSCRSSGWARRRRHK